jgi:hypothetical protein
LQEIDTKYILIFFYISAFCNEQENLWMLKYAATYT